MDHELRGNLKPALTGCADERGSPLDRIFSDVHVKQIIVEHVVAAIFREKIRESRLGICRDRNAEQAIRAFGACQLRNRSGHRLTRSGGGQAAKISARVRFAVPDPIERVDACDFPTAYLLIMPVEPYGSVTAQADGFPFFDAIPVYRAACLKRTGTNGKAVLLDVRR